MLLGIVMREKQLGSVMAIVLFLLPVVGQAYSIDRDLGVGECYTAYREAKAGWRIEGSFSVSREIEFFICDASNYTRWIRNESVVFFEHNETTSNQLFNFTIPYDSIWYVVFFNIQTNSIVSLEAQVFFIDGAGTTYTQISWTARSMLITPLLIGFTLAILSVCLLGIWVSRRTEKQPAVRYEEILPKPN
jgi:hypothetical protein